MPDDWCAKWEGPDSVAVQGVGRPGYDPLQYLPALKALCPDAKSAALPNHVYRAFQDITPTMGRSTFYRILKELEFANRINSDAAGKIFLVSESIKATEEQA